MLLVPPLIKEPLPGGAVSTVQGMFASSDEQEVRATLREVNELRRARGLQQLEPWWQLQRQGLFRPRRFIRAQRRRRCPEGRPQSTP
jgi:hypothetical protein